MCFTGWDGDPRILDPHLPGRLDAVVRAERLQEIYSPGAVSADPLGQPWRRDLDTVLLSETLLYLSNRKYSAIVTWVEKLAHF